MERITEQLIEEFARTGKTTLVPSILIGMQEEDSVSTTISYKNCIRMLRNLAAHEPTSLVSQLNSPSNKGTVKVCLKTSCVESGVVVLDLVQFTAWMFQMSLISDNRAYLLFWRAFMYVMCPRFNRIRGSFNMRITPEYSVTKCGIAVTRYIQKQFGTALSYSLDDPYYRNLYSDNRKLFWRKVIPDMMPVIGLFVDGDIDFNDRENIKGYLALYDEWE